MWRPSLLLLLLALLPLIFSSTDVIELEDSPTPATYIVHVLPTQKPTIFTSHHHWYASTLKSLPRRGRHPAPRLLYSYSHAAAGFSARLTPLQLSALRRHPAVVSVVPEQVRHLHTTHSPSFLGLSESSGIWPNSNYAEDVVVGVLDTGIWPERRSFSDDGLSPVPASWKGTCESGKDFPASSCNRKLIGARFFAKGYEAAKGPINETLESKSPRDTEGHGTHTASTAAGAAVSGAGLFEYATGVARGMATKARVAAYKICWKTGCYDSDILAAVDAAISDGVNVISLSVGSSSFPSPYYDDGIAIGAFGATRNGIVFSASAGNSGPGALSVGNVAPWILTVGASTIDREFPADVVLGDGRVFGGVSLYYGDKPSPASLPLVYAGDAGSRLCIPGQLNTSKVAGKLVLCDRGTNARVAKGAAVKTAGGAGMILANDAASGEELTADAHLLPATAVGSREGDQIRNYTKTDPNPTATLTFRGTVIGPSPPAPKVAAFSSRGPNYRTPEILKPDVIAPGVNILAAWTNASSPTDLSVDGRRVEFNIISGTSMSCPHVSGLAALLRKAHPSWSPAAVKSALMTTAYNTDDSGAVIKDLYTGSESTPFVRGAGHVTPNRAVDPGLVYDIQPDDYVAFLCTLGYSSQQLAVLVRDGSAVDCSAKKLASAGDLNYPSFAVVFASASGVVKHGRVVTNVGGQAEAAYEVEVSAPGDVDIVVSPRKLEFSEGKESLAYTVTFSSKGEQKAEGYHSFGYISWSDGSHVVRSPIAFTWQSALVSSI